MKFRSDAERREYAYAILTPEVRQTFAKSILGANLQVIENKLRHAKQYLYAQNDRRGSSANLRFILFLNLQTNFTPMAEAGLVTWRNRNGFLYMQMSQSHVIRFNKADFTDTPIKTSRTFQVYHTLPLPLEYDVSFEDPPIENLFPLLARFILKEDGTIGEFCFQDQEGGLVRSSETLDLTSYANSISQEELKTSGSNPFKWKKDGNEAELSTVRK